MKLSNLFNLPALPTQIPNLKEPQNARQAIAKVCPLHNIAARTYALGDLEQLTSATQFCLTLL
ncbi:MAG: hypothetical protein WBB82_09710 [Limnothrix sp.]